MNSAGASSSFDSFKSKKVLRSSVNKPHLSGEAPDQSPWSSKTPEKPTHPPRRPLTRRRSLRSVNQVREAAKQLRKPDLKPSVSSDPLTSSATATETLISKPNTSRSLPEKYEMLNTFFDRLGSSIRLLRLKGSMSTFTNISRQVEILTDRSFAYSHLAQLKFILPEAIEVKKILVRDDRTSCMKPDLHVTLNFRIIQDDEKLTSDSAYLLLSKLFRSKLLSFCKSNPEGDEVPEDELPEPFNRSDRSSYSVAIQKANLDSVHDITSTVSEQQPIAASLMPQSFKRRFSKQVLSQNVDHELACASNVLSPVKLSAKLPETPIKGVMTIDGTPVKLVSTPFSATPAQSTRPPVRGFMTPDEDPVMSPSKLTRRASGKRSIIFDTPVKNRPPPVKRVSTDDDDDLSDILSDDLLASIKEKELKTLHEKSPEISQAKWRKQMIAGLPKLFDTLLFYFQSVKRTVITKEELMKMITLSQLEIVDRREADEQIRLLQELASEWIYEKTASSGDLLICVNKISSPESIRARLSEAN
ncbi:hypothetical protein L1987_21955 [Smallanthus sonchifolius]|uniref:Uncharacterized protein n=1 Tax=Smallanthus sonchifolius TaxID=185202 RepID=A0ACB9ICU4_9ASTR|nr:hypothetical protein L1987_21955 [Smallanthus sonchifolius]